MEKCRLCPQNSNPTTDGRSPADGGAEDLAVLGGEVASIAKMYILALAGDPPDPNAACGRRKEETWRKHTTCILN